MIRVECTNCHAPYELDERRLPPGGLKMRCRACGTSFQVAPGGAAGGDAKTPEMPSSIPPPAVKPPEPPRGIRAPAAGALAPKKTQAFGVMDLPPPPPHAKPTKPAPPPASLAMESWGDLAPEPPAPKTAKPASQEPEPSAAASDAWSDLDLPGVIPTLASSSAKKPPPGPKEPVDVRAPTLPAPAALAQIAGTQRTGKKPVAELDLDLPAPKTFASAKGTAEPPAPRAPIAVPFPPAIGVERTVGGALGDLPELDFVGTDELGLAPRGPAKASSLQASSPQGTEPSAFGELDSPSEFPMEPIGSSSSGFPSVIPSLPPEPDLPLPRAAVDLPTPRERAAAPASKTDFGELDLPMVSAPKASLPLPDPAAPLGELPLPSLDLDFLESPQTGSLSNAHAADAHAPGAGTAAFGEVDLGGGAEDMEFGDLPQTSDTASDSLTLGDALPATSFRPGPAPTKPDARAAEEDAKAKKPRTYRALAALGVVLCAGMAAGIGLKFTPYGFFGVFAIERFLPGAGEPAAVARAIEDAEKKAASDTYADVRGSLGTLGSARKEAGLHRGLLARSVVHEGLFQARFGDDSASSARIGGMLARLSERGNDAPGMSLALAADALRRGDASAATSFAEQARRAAPSDPYAALILGEAHLRAGAPGPALELFQSALAHGGAARAQWGIARAVSALGKGDGEVLREVDATLGLSPHHAGARIAKAERLANMQHGEEALALLGELVSNGNGDAYVEPSPAEKTDAWVVLGKVHEQAGRWRPAHAAYTAALSRDGFRAEALLGDGRVLFSQRRFAEALARFEAALSASASATPEPGKRAPGVEARLRGSEALIALDRAAEARTALEQLVQAEPHDAEVLLALGHVEQALDDPNAAEQRFREAVESAPTRVEPYLALAELFSSLDRGPQAEEVLGLAARAVPESAQKHTAIGTLQLHRNNAERAIASFSRAMELDPASDAAHFGFGVASRRAGHLEDAARAFDALAARSPDFPGLSLERGMLFEVQGRAALAATAYRRALLEHPDDTDLLLRLGAAQVAADQLDAAEETLEKVHAERPNSAEAEHFIGRIAFARGEVESAAMHFERAVQLDTDRAEFHLYAGWAALERGDLSRALSAIDTAIERDPSLGDAWWIRGEVRLRAGQVRDALGDLSRARALKPGRYAAIAAMGECFDQLGDRANAIASYEQATSLEPENGRWLYRLGRLYLDAGNRRSAETVLARAVRIGDAATTTPTWTAEAHRLYADALRLGGSRADAIAHYRRYLALAPEGALDRGDVEGILGRLE